MHAAVAGLRLVRRMPEREVSFLVSDEDSRHDPHGSYWEILAQLLV